MASDWQDKRETFRHGDLPGALVEAALERLEAGGIESLSLRELARDVGVNHRALYRHFPDKLSLLARVAQTGWQNLGKTVLKEMKGKKPGEDSLVAGAQGFFKCARAHPNLFLLMAGPRINIEGAFPDLDRAVWDTLKPFLQGFLDAGTDQKIARVRAATFVAALTGVVTQMLHKRLNVPSAKAQAFVADTCRMMIKGMH